MCNKRRRNSSRTSSDFLFNDLESAQVNAHLSITPPESPLRPLLGARESSSSKKTTQGAEERALENTEHIANIRLHVHKHLYRDVLEAVTSSNVFI